MNIPLRQRERFTVELTDKLIAALKPGTELRDAVCRGLGVRHQGRAATFFIRTLMNGRRQYVTIGAHRNPITPALAKALEEDRWAWDYIRIRDVDTYDLHVEDARTIANVLKDIGRKSNPFQGSSIHRFASVADAYEKARSGSLKTASDLARYLRIAKAEWGTQDIAAIRPGDVQRLFDHITTERGAQSANNWLAAISTMFAWALIRYDLPANPAAGIKRNRMAPRERVLTDDELRAIWHATFVNTPGAEAAFGRAVRFMIATGARTGNETLALTTDQIDMTECTATWTGADYKTERAHILPLTDTALAQLTDAPSPHIFSTDGAKPIGGRNRHKRALDARSGVTDWQLRDIRRTVRTGLARLAIDDTIAERVLGHSVGRISRTYNAHSYLAEKRAALTTWEAHLLEIISGS